MSTEENNEVVKKRQEDIDATTKTTENDNNKEETLNTVSYEDIKESKKDTNEIEDVVQEQMINIVLELCYI